MEPMTGMMIASLAMSAGGLGYSIFGGKKPSTPDLTEELNRIGALFAQARAAARESITQEYRAGRSQAVANLAARTTYRSPVAQNIFNSLEAARLQAIGRSEGQLAGQEAQTRAGALNSLLGYNMQGQQWGAQRTAAIGSGLTSMGGSLMGAALAYRPSPTTPAAVVPSGPYVGPLSPGYGQAPLVPNSPMAYQYQGPQAPFGMGMISNPGYNWWGK